MATTFTRTTRALQLDDFWRSAWFLVGALSLLAAWGVWFVWGEVALVVVSDEAHLDWSPPVWQVVAPADGQLGAWAVAVDEAVARGQELVAIQTPQHRLRLNSPAAGRVAALAALSPGSAVRAGDALATIVPDGELIAMATFSPDGALGRLAVGQPARVRLDGLPASAYGDVGATVTRVASLSDDRRIRVELALDPAAADSRLPLQRGLTGSVIVEVEHVSPATLVLRAAGHRLAARPAVEGRAP